MHLKQIYTVNRKYYHQVIFLLETYSVIGFATTSGKRDSISDIIEACGIENQEVEYETKASVFGCSMPAKIQVPLILVLWQAQFLDPAIFNTKSVKICKLFASSFC